MQTKRIGPFILISLLLIFSNACRDGSAGEQDLTAHIWTQKSDSLIAHAGGGIIGINGGNSREAFITNYTNGHKVFEFDLILTSDSEIAALHDWHGYSGIKTHEEFKQIKIYDVFTTMDIDDIFGIMLEHKDIYIVTDTKSFEDDSDTTTRQFSLIRDKALKYDEELLERVIPQIYSQEMYGLIKDVYPFKSIIYTLYASPDSDKEVTKFVKDKDEIKVITMAPSRFGEEFCAALTKMDKLIYLFTINDIEEARGYLLNGAHGLYTDFILPGDL